MVTKTDRHDAIRELRRAGLSVGDIAEKIGCSRQTIWRATRSLETVAPTPTSTPAPTPDSNGHADLEAAQSVGLGVLLDRARGGSVSAASTLFKAASAEIRADKCVNHIAAADLVTAARIQYHLWVLALKGPLQRRLLMEYPDLDPGQLEGLIDDAIDSVTRELNTRFAAEDDHE